MNKYQHYVNLAQEQAGEVTRTAENWMGMLNTAARLYKYPFDEQLLIHAQKPDATACASIKLWNKKMQRYVKKGKKGIALLDNADGEQRLKYVFDVADTHGGRYGGGRTPNVWQMRREHEGVLAETLGRRLNQDGQQSPDEMQGFTPQFVQALAKQLADAYINEHLENLTEIFGDESLNSFAAILTDSTAYTIMSRLGMDTTEIAKSPNFQNISNIDTQTAVQALGQGVSGLSKNVLRGIEKTIKHYEQEQQHTTRSQNIKDGRNVYDREHREVRTEVTARDNLSLGGGLSDPGHWSDRGGGGLALVDQVRHDAQIVSERQERDSVHEPALIGAIVPPLSGEGGTSRTTPTQHHGAVGEEEPHSREREGHRSTGVDGTHEQLTLTGRGNNTYGTDLRIPIATQVVYNWDNVVAEAKNSVADYTEPFVIINWSESENFTDFERHTFEEADQKFKAVEALELAERAEQGKYGGYNKTSGMIFYKDDPADTELSTYEFRYDIGDYSGDKSGLYNHVHNFWTNVQRGLDGISSYDSYIRGFSYTQESADGVFRMLDILQPKRLEKALKAQQPTGLPITRGIAGAFQGHYNFRFAKSEDGSVYISNGFFIAKTLEKDIDAVTEQINKHRRDKGIEPIETPIIMEYINKSQGNFPLTQPPFVIDEEGGNKALKSYVYADEKQYFKYNGNYVDTFQSAAGSETRLFVNDSASYDLQSHNMLIKSSNDELLGLILPISISEDFYRSMAEHMPLEVPYKSAYDRIKENPTNDPYIGREFFDGKQMHIVARLVDVSGTNMYLVPTVKDGVVSRSATYVNPEHMEERIAVWESNRISNEQAAIQAAAKAEAEAAARAIYKNTNGFADNLPPLQKARVLDALDKSFITEDYGLLNTKGFIEAAIRDGKTVETVQLLKKKYQSGDYGLDDYLSEYAHNKMDEIKVRKAVVSLEQNRDPDSSYASFLRDEHPYAHYLVFGDKSVLDQSHFTTEYRLVTGQTANGGDIFFPISKTAHDYGKYLIDNGIFAEQSRPQLTAEKLTSIDGTDYYLFHAPPDSDITPAVSIETLSLITEKADRYVICADVCYISDDSLKEFNIEFRKMPHGFGLLPAEVQEKVSAINPEHEVEYSSGRRITAIADTAPKIPPDRMGDIVLYKIGGFYEAYGDDAATLSAQLGLTVHDGEDDPAIPLPFVAFPIDKLAEYTDKFHDSNTQDFTISTELLDGTRDITHITHPFNHLDGWERHVRNHDFRITDPYLGEGGPKTKYAYNVAAIKTLQTIEAENRHATPEEQEVLSRYVGWGGIQEAFDENKPAWAKEYEELKSLLAPEEYTAARASVLNAHYTSPVVISAMYEALENMGVKGGNILEPAMGVGNFFGLMPESMQSAKLYGVELDSITGRIAQQLYPQADIKVMGFEKTTMPDSFFDVAIGNVPFGDYKLSEKRYDKYKFNIHDHFFAKTLDQVRPGGIIAFVTSKGTLDKANPAVRKYIAQRADLLGAVRLPNNAFLKNAGTEVTSDIIFLQKREGLRDIEPDWVHLGQVPDALNPDKLIAVNSYFAENPHMILGQMTTESGKRMYGNENYADCVPIEGVDLGEQLRTALSYVKGQITDVDRDYDLDDLADTAQEGANGIKRTIPADPNVKNYSYAVVDDSVYMRENSVMHLVEKPVATMERIKGMAELRDITRDLIDLQLYDADPQDIADKQALLNDRYDSFTKKYGLISSTGNARAFDKDSSYYLLCSLENLDDDGNLKSKSDMFTKRTIRQQTEIIAVDTSVEALAVSIAKKAKVDMPYMAQLTGFTDEKIAEDLRGIIFRDLGMGTAAQAALYKMGAHNVGGATEFLASRPFVTADEYLSGNVREKLAFAKGLLEKWNGEGWNEISGQIGSNVQSLTQVQPKDLEAHEIAVRLGSTWVDKQYYEQFMNEVLKTPNYLKNTLQLNYSEYGAAGSEWSIAGKTKISSNDIAAYSTFGTRRKSAYAILEDSLNLRDVRVTDTVEDVNGKKTYPVNKKETIAALEKQKALKEAFADWIFQDPARRQALVKKYNELFNSTRVREFDGSHIEFAGSSPEIKLMPHQRGAIARILYGGNTLLAHEVGAGKTFEMIGAAMESKRLGLCNKSMMVVPNHLTLQTASEFLRLYPSANILVATKRDFEPKNRKKFCARIATGDYDAVIIGHSQFEKIPLSQERQERILQDQIDEIMDALSQAKGDFGQRYTVKQMEKTVKNLETRLSSMTDTSRKDDVITFEQLGINRLFVDEAHHYKNLFLLTKMRNVAGISTSEAQKSTDMFMKCQYMDELTGGKGIIFATGTPISNSMTELYTLQRYLQYGKLQETGLGNFDSWASTFGETVTAPELSPQGDGYRARTRFAKFQNLPELMKMFGEVADIKTADMLELERPDAIYETIVAKPSEIQKDLVQSLSERATAVQRKLVEPSEDNFLKITMDGRKIGLDQRLMNPDLPDEPGSKINLCTENIYKIWDETSADRLTQLVFCDASTPSGKKDEFNVYDDIKDKLIAKGIPKDEIAFIHDCNTDQQKAALFAKVRSGKVRVLLGSTQKMGSGTNVQDKLIAIHDVDCPWRPADLEQRAGRIIRQGNENPEVKIFRYVTDSTFDAYLFQTVENKQKFIGQIMTSKSPVRACDDVDESALSYAEVKALCAGNPLIAEKMNLEIEVSRLKILRGDYQSDIYRLQDSITQAFPMQIEKAKASIANYKADMAVVATNTHKGNEGISPMTIGGRVYTDRAEAGEALLLARKSLMGVGPETVGSYRGLQMQISFDSFYKEYTLHLKGSNTQTLAMGDSAGNIMRLDNAVDKMAESLQRVESRLENLLEQMEAAKKAVHKPFPQEAEYQEKIAKLAELDAVLNADDREATSTKEQLVADKSRITPGRVR